MITQVPLSVETPRLPAIVGSETLAMVPSSTCMKVPSASAIAVIASAHAGQRRGPRRRPAPLTARSPAVAAHVLRR